MDFQFCLVTPTALAVITTEIISSLAKVVCTAAAPDVLFLGLPEEVFHVVRLVVLETDFPAFRLDDTKQAAGLVLLPQLQDFILGVNLTEDLVRLVVLETDFPAFRLDDTK